MELRWKASFSATCFHAAACIEEGLPAADAQLSTVLESPLGELLREINACGFSAESMLPLLVGLAADYENNRQLIETTVKKLSGAGSVNDPAISRLAACVAGLEAAVLHERPQLVDELALRARPLREQWEAHGPGLLQQVAALVDGDLFLAPAAEVVLVSPLVGGHGRAHLMNNRVTFEAVLTNPHAELPETMRLGWLLVQLNLDLPLFSDPIPGHRLPLIAGLATVPLVLTAAETLELATFSRETLSQTLSCWHLPANTAERLHAWWRETTTSNTRWTVAMAALDAMLSE